MTVGGRRGFTLGAAVLCFAAVVVEAQPWSGGAGLEVRVSSRRAGPLSGARVELRYRGSRESGGPPPVATDGRGRAVVLGLADGIWQVEVQHPEFMSYVAVVRLDSRAKPEVTASFLEATTGGSTPIQVKLSRARGGPASPPLPTPPESPAPEAATTPPAAEEPATSTPSVETLRRPVVVPAPTPEEPSTTISPEEVEPAPPVPDVALEESVVEGEPIDAQSTGTPIVAAPTGTTAQRRAVEPAPPAEIDEPRSDPAADEAPPLPIVDPDPSSEPEPGEPTAQSTAPPEAEPAPPLVETPAAQVPAVEVPAVELPAVELPVADAPVPEPPAVEPPVVDAEPDSPLPADSSPPAMMPDPDPVADAEMSAVPAVSAAPRSTEAAPPAAASPAEWRAYSRRTCPECKPGEWAVTVETPLAAGACPSDLAEAVHDGMAALASAGELELAAYSGRVAGADGALARVATASGLRTALFDAHTSGCATLGVVLPRGGRFVGFLYEYQGAGGAEPCLPDRPCAGGEVAFMGPPRITRGRSATVVHALAVRQTGDGGSARLTVYFRAPSANWRPE